MKHCSHKQAQVFKQIVLAFMATENLTCKKVRAYRSFGGEVRLYNGKITHRLPLRTRRRLIDFNNSEHTLTYEYHHEPIPEVDYTSVYKDKWEADPETEKKTIRDFIKGQAK